MKTTNAGLSAPPPARIPPQNYPAEKARQGEIALKTKWARTIFFAGLVGSFILLLLLALVLGIIG